jgi:hypothetical protein
VNVDAPVQAGLVQRLVRQELVRRRAIVELHEERGAQRVAAIVGHEMTIADDALAKAADVALLILQQGPPGLRRFRLVPAVDRPLGRLRSVVLLERFSAQPMARIVRQVSGSDSARHLVLRHPRRKRTSGMSTTETPGSPQELCATRRRPELRDGLRSDLYGGAWPGHILW